MVPGTIRYGATTNRMVQVVHPRRTWVLKDPMTTKSEALESRIGVSFSDSKLLIEALTHRSYMNEHPEWKGHHNERLEFLGDAVLELSVTRHLFEEFPDDAEGRLTNLRAALVRTETLAIVGAELQLIDAMRLSRGEAKDSGRARDQILANAMEALIGAMFLDQGFDVVDKFIQEFILSKLPDVIAQKKVKDAKSILQEEAQSRLSLTPHYEVLKKWGPDHQRQFQIGAYLGGDLAGEGEGASKQDAQQAAAADALQKKKWGAS